MDNLRRLFYALKDAVEIGNAIDDAYAADPENEVLEEAFDNAYKAEYEARRNLANAITRLTAEIDFKTALRMTYNPKLAALIDRLA